MADCSRATRIPRQFDRAGIRFNAACSGGEFLGGEFNSTSTCSLTDRLAYENGTQRGSSHFCRSANRTDVDALVSLYAGTAINHKVAESPVNPILVVGPHERRNRRGVLDRYLSGLLVS